MKKAHLILLVIFFCVLTFSLSSCKFGDPLQNFEGDDAEESQDTSKEDVNDIINNDIIDNDVVDNITPTMGVIYNISDDCTYSSVVGYEGNDVEVVIASEYQGVPVVSIYDYAFQNKLISSITIPDSVTSIGDHAFFQCSDLKSITIPNSIISIGFQAFNYCSKLTTITIPDSVTSIGHYAFGYCSNLTNIEVGTNNTAYKSIDGNLYTKDETTLLQYAIGKTNTTFEIPDSVTSTGAYTFWGCSNLTSLKIPSALTSIGSWAFQDCSTLMHIEVDENNTVYKSIDGNLYTKDGKKLIKYATGKTDTIFNIPDSVTSIGYQAFEGGENLRSIIISDNVDTIEFEAFQKCSRLESIIIPDSVYYIGSAAFNGCSNLKSITIPNNITTIESETFAHCYQLTSVVFSSSIMSICDRAFNSCNNLKDVYYTSSEEEWNTISIGLYNSVLDSATIHYNYISE